MLVTDSPIVKKDNYIDETARQQEIASRRHLFANRTAEKEMKYIPLLSKKSVKPNGRISMTQSASKILIRRSKTKTVVSPSE